MMDEILDRDGLAQAALIEQGEISARELVEGTIQRIERLNPDVNAVSSRAFEQALKRADSPIQGLFAGVPFLVKEVIAYPGLRHALGSRLFAQNWAKEGSPYTEALDRAGLITLGTTTSSEFGLLGSTETQLNGITQNPRFRGLSAGGSSGGAAAAVASGMVPLAHASDGGGSIRIPASMHGLFGFKPGGGRILPSAPSDMNGLVVDHCITKSVRDSACLFASTENGEVEGGPVGYIQGPSTARLRIGFYHRTLMGERASGAALAYLNAAVDLLKSLGHDVCEITGPAIEGRVVSDGFFALAGASIAQVADMMAPMLGMPLGAEHIEPFTLELLEWYRTLPAEYLPQMVGHLDEAGQKMRTYLDEFDVVLSPTMPILPPKLGTLSPKLGRRHLIDITEQLAGYTPIHNIAGVPAMSVPLAVDGQYAKIGSHFAAGKGAEARLFALAYELEAACPW